MKRAAFFIAVMLMTSILAGQSEQKPKKNDTRDLNTYIQLMRMNLKTEKANIIVQSIEFTEEQSKEFWPVYKDYEEKLDKISDKRVAFIKEFAENYETMTQDRADKIIQQAFNYREERLNLVKELYNNVKEILGSVKAAKLVQIENQINLIIDLKINSELPLMKLGDLQKEGKDKK